MVTLLPRLLGATLRRALQSSPVVVVTGARQTGKSTLAAAVDPSREYTTLDDIDALARAQAEPDAFVRGPAPMTIDEIQRAPALLLAIKRAIDRQRTPGRFLLTGSANLHLLKAVSESLAGRAVYLTLQPLTRREQLGLATPGCWEQLFDAADDAWPEIVRAGGADTEDWRALARRGGYPTPAVHLRDSDDRRLWFAGYTQTYLERDLRDLSSVASLVDFRRLMRATCLRLGNLVNQTELGRDVGMPQTTVRRHLGLLELSYQLALVPAFTAHRTTRLIKTPKAYWSDTGLAMHLADETEPRGAHLENLVLSDLLAWAGSRVDAPSIMYWRTASGDEVDFVVEWKGKLLPIEVKSSHRLRPDDARPLRSFLAHNSRRSRAGLLLHTGDEIAWLGDRILAVPWWRVI